MKELDDLRAIFLADDVDDELRADNEQKIKEWETALIFNEAFAGWCEHDITRQVLAKARETYKDLSLILATNRTLTEQQRYSMWAKQDAALWLLSLIEVDAKGTLKQIHHEIRTAMHATN